MAPAFSGISLGRSAYDALPQQAGLLKKYLRDVAGAYRLVLDMARFDPQELAKNQASHEFAVSEFEKALIKHRARDAAAA